MQGCRGKGCKMRHRRTPLCGGLVEPQVCGWAMWPMELRRMLKMSCRKRGFSPNWHDQCCLMMLLREIWLYPVPGTHCCPSWNGHSWRCSRYSYGDCPRSPTIFFASQLCAASTVPARTVEAFFVSAQRELRRHSQKRWDIVATSCRVSEVPWLNRQSTDGACAVSSATGKTRLSRN